MSGRYRDHRFPSEWPPPRPTLSRPASYAYLLDLDEGLAQEFDLRMRTVARQVATVLVFDVPAGEWDATEWFAALEPRLGILVVDGALAIDTEVCGRVATELVGPGDLLQPWERDEADVLDRSCTCKVLVSARLAHLDTDFVERVRPWPVVTEALLRRAGRRVVDLSAQRAIAGHPRLEVRIVLLLWHLAARWGRVEPGGVCVRLPITHRLLGRLVGAERPSVSHALSRLAHTGLVTGHTGEWHLHGSIESQLEALNRRDDAEPVPAVRAERRLRAMSAPGDG